MAVQRLILPALFALALGVLSAAPIPLEKALGLPGMQALLPPGSVPSKAAAVPALSPGDPLRVALLVREKSAVRLILARQQGKTMVSELAVQAEARGAHAMTLDRVRPGRAAALAVHWSTSGGGHRGKLSVWALEPKGPALALEAVSEGFYFEEDRLVLYEPETDSAVSLPSVYEWQGPRLVRSKSSVSALEQRLMSEYDEVLTAFAESGATAAPNRMVVDIALQKGRLLERQGKRQDARKTFELAATMVERLPASMPAAERKELEERAAEARRRAERLK